MDVFCGFPLVSFSIERRFRRSVSLIALDLKKRDSANHEPIAIHKSESCSHRMFWRVHDHPNKASIFVYVANSNGCQAMSLMHYLREGSPLQRS
jgi:hypothetical protein